MRLRTGRNNLANVTYHAGIESTRGDLTKMQFRNLITFAALAAAAVAISMTSTHNTGRAAGGPQANPLLAKWEGPYGGVPPFDKIRIADFKPALETAMA